MERVVSVTALPDYRLEVEFSDGAHGVLDYSDRLFGPLMSALRDPQRFAEVRVDEHGVVCWPNGADLAPDAMYERLKGGAIGAR